jgi:hypothetical protein
MRAHTQTSKQLLIGNEKAGLHLPWNVFKKPPKDTLFQARVTAAQRSDSTHFAHASHPHVFEGAHSSVGDSVGQTAAQRPQTASVTTRSINKVPDHLMISRSASADIAVPTLVAASRLQLPSPPDGDQALFAPNLTSLAVSDSSRAATRSITFRSILKLSGRNEPQVESLSSWITSATAKPQGASLSLSLKLPAGATGASQAVRDEFGARDGVALVGTRSKRPTEVSSDITLLFVCTC